ncbi:aminotransferase class-III [Beutenbergia cavernae DSM 12333]|uniref:Aminotransferase class-III n=1 Tax=Beutenbergia cavernae (strain ATCC BAA-8 / DSM 12333 / CCUG 43141 / JCM 11478 / NBRC 16432 / NCIMB 13614 / HKI 0122) TaxID=471853 RepID=C5C2N0_BEUC1|nr:aspartate aminotransferase family protein [Beutenbergia cavernae]ACQ79716.1 aminotransferase class-III [Beutenbergia cavernae DSM 12333]
MSTVIDSISARLDRRARQHVPGGVNSNVRLAAPHTYFERGVGARLFDVDGRDYVDYLLGQGPNILGHAPEKLQSDVAQAVRRGMLYGAQHEAEVLAAEQVCEILEWPEMVRFGVSGTESVQAALRLARAETGRRRFIRFEGHYHGWLDTTLASWSPDGECSPASAGQLSDHLAEAIPTPWNDLEAVRLQLEQHDDVAAIITEPVMLNAGSIVPRDGYLEGLRELADAFGVVLIFDEVITGFRVALGGAAQRYGVTPDLAVYGKAMAAGWPVSMLAGRADLMERFGSGEVNHSGTFNASVMATAATLSATTILREDDPYARMEAYGERLMDEVRGSAARHGLGLHVQGLGMAFHVSFSDGKAICDYRDLGRTDTERYGRLSRVLADHGVWVAGRGVWYVSAAHDERDMADTLTRVDQAFAEFARHER